MLVNKSLTPFLIFYYSKKPTVYEDKQKDSVMM